MSCEMFSISSAFEAHLPLTAGRRVDHVDAAGCRHDLTITDGMWYVHMTIYTALYKLHVVFRQSSCLISEDVLHLRETRSDF